MNVVITTTEKTVTVNGKTQDKGGFTIQQLPEGYVAITNKQVGLGLRAKLNSVTIDGAIPTDYNDLIALSQGLFKTGGTEPANGVQSVTGDLVGGTAENPTINMPTEIAEHPTRTDNPHSVTSEQVGLGNVDNTSDLNKPISSAAQVELDQKQDISEKGQAGGYPELGPDGLIPIEYTNVSGLNFIGPWDASTNTPTLNDGAGNVGDFYKVSVGGTHDFGVQPYTFVVGDWVIFAAGVWQRLGSSDTVSMVNGKVGAVVVNKTDVGLSDVDNTSDLDKPISTATNIALSGKSDTNHTHQIADVEGLQEVLGTGGSALIAQETTTSTTQYIIADIPADAPDLLQFELYIPDTIAPSFISMRLNGVNSGVYKHVLQNVNNASYSLSRNYTQNQLRVLASANGPVVGRYNIRITGTINNVAGQVKVAMGESYLAGTSPGSGPDVNNFFGSVHDQEITDGKITQLLFVAMNSSGTGRIATGSVLKIYGIK